MDVREIEVFSDLADGTEDVFLERPGVTLTFFVAVASSDATLGFLVILSWLFVLFAALFWPVVLCQRPSVHYNTLYTSHGCREGNCRALVYFNSGKGSLCEVVLVTVGLGAWQ